MQDIGRQIGIALRWLPLVLVFALGAGAVAYVWASGRPVVLEATGTLRVQPGPDPTISQRTDAVLAAVQYAAEMGSPGFAQAIVRELGLNETRDALLGRVSFEANQDTDVALIQMAVRSTDPEEAQTIAKAFGDELIARKTKQLYTADVRDATQQVRNLETDADALRRRLTTLRNKTNKTPEDFSQIANLPGQIAALQQAIVNLRPFTTQYVRDLPTWYLEPRLPTQSVVSGPLYWTLLAVLVGGMAAVGLAFVVEYLRTVGKVRTDRDLELATAQATLGGVIETHGAARRKDADRLVMLRYPKSDEAEAYRGLIARIGFSGGTTRTLMVTSAKATDSKSLVAANIAVAYAEAGRNVILVDADHRSPRVHSFFGVKNDRGLTTILEDSSTPLGWATVPSPHPRLGLMPSGPVSRENTEPLGSRQLNALLRRLLHAADLVIFDGPSVDASLDAAVLAEGLDGTVLVVPRDSSEDETTEAAHALQVADAEFIGAVLYRKVRRSRKGAKAKVTAAPAGWGPTWPMLYEQPAMIPAATRSASEKDRVRPSEGAPAQASAYRPPQPARPPQPPVPGQRPVTGQPPAPGQRPVTGQPPVPGQRPVTGQPPAPGQPPVPARGPYAAPFQAASVRSQTPVGGVQQRPADGDHASVASHSPNQSTTSERAATAPDVPGSPQADPRVSIPVQPDPARPPRPDQTSPESVLG